MASWAWSLAVWALLAPALPRSGRTSAVTEGDVVLARHQPLDDVDPAAEPTPWIESAPLTLVAAAGERERAAFVVYTGGRQGTLDVQRPELASATGALPADSTALRGVRRVPVRTRYRGAETEVVGRFAPLFSRHAVGSGRFEEIWLEVEVPAGTSPGVYAGTLEVAVGTQRVHRQVRLRVRDMSLGGTGDKHLGMFYSVLAKLDEPDRVRRELADMRAHGVDALVMDVRPRFGWGPDRKLMVDVAPVRTALQLAHEAGFRGEVVVDGGLVPLARALGHLDVAYGGADGASLDGAEAFDEAAARTLARLSAVAEGFGDLQVHVMHLDEIFERGRLPLFERLAARSHAAGLSTYATLSTVDEAADDMRRRIDAVLDVRSHHGYSFEWWLARGGSVDAYERELARSDDAAWFYHNERGTYFDGRWSRLVNGLYLWASPFSTHLTWAYQAFDHHPLDDADGTYHDFGVAFPDPSDPSVLMPTRIWTAAAEGYDDLRYLAALQAAIDRYGSRAPEAAARAEAFLQGLRDDVMRVPAGIDASGLRREIGTPDEAPLLRSLAQRYDDAALALMRMRVEEHVHALRVAAGSTG